MIELIDLKKMPLVTESQSVKQICKPLKLFGITDFWFMRGYPNGTFLDLGTHLPWATLFFENFYQLKYEKKDMEMHTFFREGMALWDHNPENKIWQEGKEFSLGHGISIAKHTNAYVDIYAFYTTQNNHKMNDFYINHLTILEKFILYFNEKAQSLIKKADNNRFIMPDKYREKSVKKVSDTALIQEFLIRIGKERHSLNTVSYKPLTYKELECLAWLCMGKSSEEIALILNRSKRTIETHINNMKIKLNCTKATSLIYTAVSLGLLLPEMLSNIKMKKHGVLTS
jgi:DNA-binding CsgD family transcriptional regulator